MRHHTERPDFDDKTKQRIVTLRRDSGLTYQQLSERFGRSISHIRKLCSEGGVAADPRGRHAYGQMETHNDG